MTHYMTEILSVRFRADEYDVTWLFDSFVCINLFSSFLLDCFHTGTKNNPAQNFPASLLLKLILPCLAVVVALLKL